MADELKEPTSPTTADEPNNTASITADGVKAPDDPQMTVTADEGSASRLYSPVAVVILRIVLGATFIVSGFSKAIDPWGFIFKIEEYLAVWGITQPRTVILVAAIGLSAYELVLGLMLACGCYKRTAPWLLTLSMLFMLPLTLYTWIANPVSDCGCFGELFTLSNAATFWKNVVITLGLIYLCVFNRRFNKGVYDPAIQWIIGVATFFFTLSIALYGYNIQPLIDFRPYPVGTNLYDVLTGEAADDSLDDVVFIYERDGVKQDFTADNLPDSTWTFVDRSETAKKGETPAGFAIYDGDEDVSDEAISPEGPQLILVIPESNRIDISYTYTINEFDKAIRREGGSTVGLLASSDEGINRWLDLSMADYPCYSVDDTALKQLARGTMSAVYLEDGVIKWKRSLSTFDFDLVDSLGTGETQVSDLQIDDKPTMTLALTVFVGFLLVVALFQEFFIRLFRKFKKKA